MRRVQGATMLQGNRSPRRLVALVLAVATIGGAAVAGAASTATAADVPVYVASRDFATDVYGDPWDYSNSADQNTDMVGNGTYSLSGGQLHGTLAPATYFMPVSSVPGSLPYDRDGATHPITSSRYTRLSFSMDQPYSGRSALITWFTCRETNASCMGGQFVRVQPGRHTYDVALDAASTVGAKVPWTRASVVALRVQPIAVNNGEQLSGTADIDWMRLHTGTTPQDAVPPGDYGTYRVVARPLPIVDSPDRTEGRDIATVQRGRPWELTTAAAAQGITLRDATLLGYGAGGMRAQNAGPIVNDPEVVFPISPFAGSSYHWLSWSMSYTGGFDGSDTVGGGKIARLIWADRGVVPLQVGNDVLTFSGKNGTPVGPNEPGENTIDLTARNPLDESMPAGSAGWAGQTISSMRWDPNEDRGTSPWALKSLHLRADPSATGSTTIRFHDATYVPGSTVKVVMSLDGTTTTRTLVQGRAVTSGANSVPFALGSSPSGNWTARVTITHPDGTSTTALSNAPIRIHH